MRRAQERSRHEAARWAPSEEAVEAPDGMVVEARDALPMEESEEDVGMLFAPLSSA